MKRDRPDPAGLAGLLDAERTRLLPDTRGEVSDGTPLLAAAGAECFGLAAMTVDGELHATAEADLELSIQSVVKPWIYALALTDRGDEVHEHVGVEPTGAPFDAVLVEEQTGRPPNAMVNAGALVTSALVRGRDPEEQVGRILDLCSRAAGRELRVDDEVAAHEVEHGDRNRALGWLMHDSGALPGAVDDALLVLSRACAVVVTAADLAAMGATLATWGRQPVTGEQVLAPEVVTDVLSVMATCGMYDGVGRWVHRVGMPAKSGVSGTLVAVAPGVLGLGSCSAPLNERGNSVRGIAASETVSRELGLHRFAAPRDGARAW